MNRRSDIGSFDDSLSANSKVLTLSPEAPDEPTIVVAVPIALKKLTESF
jgi:hypothetical protein